MLKTKIRELRMERHMEQSELARLVDVRRETIGRLERGQYNPSLKLAMDIAKVFHTTVEDIFVFTEEMGRICIRLRLPVHLAEHVFHKCGRKGGKRMRRLWGSKGGRQPLFHHDHIPPLPKLVACAGIEGGPLKPQLRMQPLAVIVWHGNQRVKGGIPLLLQERDQAGIQRPPNPPLLRTRGHVDAQLR